MWSYLKALYVLILVLRRNKYKCGKHYVDVILHLKAYKD